MYTAVVKQITAGFYSKGLAIGIALTIKLLNGRLGQDCKKIEICMTRHNAAEDLEKNYKEMKDRI